MVKIKFSKKLFIGVDNKLSVNWGKIVITYLVKSYLLSPNIISLFILFPKFIKNLLYYAKFDNTI